ncbi:protein-lysine N-methyltransferase EFM4 [Dichotomopilus funicola]|uniref:Protein-lysine N-methyltransferase EFM4 n=1 Tax=Dichotomopilus funicola TaxID=1934379 RepID=A0AAN6UX27_9PEZI|nr:protein-lysine N-methyltransferase EFM4 [Dichotomopilus funicola]
MTDTTAPAHLDPSALGTREYWDNLYTTELRNHADNPRDEGTVWFDDSDAEAKMVAFLEERVDNDDEGLHSRGGGLVLDRDTASVLDLGCGNGSMLFALRDEGWRGRLLGVDYSVLSVELARRVGESRREGGAEEEEDDEAGDGDNTGENDEGNGDRGDHETETEVEFKVWDVLNGSFSEVTSATTTTTTPSSTSDPPQQPPIPPQQQQQHQPLPCWHIVLDKGTFDAVSLSGEHDAHGRRVFENYGARVLHLLRPGGLFLVTSCNWTEAELRDWFEVKTGVVAVGVPQGQGEEEEKRFRLRLAGKVEYPSFRFGGVQGQTISTLCFEKVRAEV